MRYTFLPAKSSLYVVKIEKVAGNLDLVRLESVKSLYRGD